MTSIGTFQRVVHLNAINKGFWEGAENRSIPVKLALIHSEISEALEDYRDNRMITTTSPESGKPSGFPSELADAVIRIMDLSERLGIDLEEEIRAKHQFNLDRPFLHGGRKI